MKGRRSGFNIFIACRNVFAIIKLKYSLTYVRKYLAGFPVLYRYPFSWQQEEKHRREVLNLTLTEFDEAKYKEVIREETREEIILNCLKNGKTCEQISDFLGILPEEVKNVEEQYFMKS